MTLLGNGNVFLEEVNATESVLFTTDSLGLLQNVSQDDNKELYPLELVIPITIVYGVIFITGVVGNVSTCIVIAGNKSMHTATNYYLFSLAISDMLLLISGLPPEMYRIWSPETYVFGQAFCVLQGFAAETSANATVLTITAFTVERYLAICHPFLSHTMSKLSRAVRYIVAIWIVALCLAAPQAIQFGVEYELKGEVQSSRCTVVKNFFEHAFEISTFLFFVGPMTLITVLYVLIGVQLRKSRNIAAPKRESLVSTGCNEVGGTRGRNTAAQKRVVKMLIAVVAAFFICWAPFHAQRLLAVYLSSASKEAQDMTITIYMILMYASGILYFLSTTINPVLYHIMSNKFREAFKKTFSNICVPRKRRQKHPPSRTYPILTRYPPSMRHLQRSVSDGVENHINEQLALRDSHQENFLGCTNAKLNSSAGAKTRRGNFRTRVLSESSRTTALSTLSKTMCSEESPCLNNSYELQKCQPSVKNKDEEEDSAVGDKKYLEKIGCRMFRLFNKNKSGRGGLNNNFYRNASVDSTFTISNSSLQDMDEMEYSSSDLVKYMEEINEDVA